MFENVTNLQFQANKLNTGLQILREQIVPILRKQHGLLSLGLIPRPDINTVTVISLWDTPASARAVEALPEYRRQVQKLDALIRVQSFAQKASSMMKIDQWVVSPN